MGPKGPRRSSRLKKNENEDNGKKKDENNGKKKDENNENKGDGNEGATSQPKGQKERRSTRLAKSEKEKRHSKEGNTAEDKDNDELNPRKKRKFEEENGNVSKEPEGKNKKKGKRNKISQEEDDKVEVEQEDMLSDELVRNFVEKLKIKNKFQDDEDDENNSQILNQETEKNTKKNQRKKIKRKEEKEKVGMEKKNIKEESPAKGKQTFEELEEMWFNENQMAEKESIEAAIRKSEMDDEEIKQAQNYYSVVGVRSPPQPYQYLSNFHRVSERISEEEEEEEEDKVEVEENMLSDEVVRNFVEKLKRKNRFQNNEDDETNSRIINQESSPPQPYQYLSNFHRVSERTSENSENPVEPEPEPSVSGLNNYNDTNDKQKDDAGEEKEENNAIPPDSDEQCADSDEDMYDSDEEYFPFDDEPAQSQDSPTQRPQDNMEPWQQRKMRLQHLFSVAEEEYTKILKQSHLLSPSAVVRNKSVLLAISTEAPGGVPQDNKN